MTHKVVFRPAAQADLFAIYNYIENDSGNRRAGDYVNRIEAACMALSTFPERGTVRDAVGPGVRIVGFERRVFIVFRVNGDTVVILRVLYGGSEDEADT
ncbi:type II toxin-antitoxin system RelE/ParE family toxin [Mesorhizobium sp. M1342]|uniref:type II toxin-antitoxin system RelE/ParE family toxin n=1 Tax=Mesorhizobium sp. M1342 TaxID=2957088 RepID=UPI0033352FEB